MYLSNGNMFNTNRGFCVCQHVCINIKLFAFAGRHQSAGMLVFTHQRTYKSKPDWNLPGCVYIFSHNHRFLSVKCPTLLTQTVARILPYLLLLLLPVAWIKFRKKIILMRVRGVGINGWIIFRKRKTSSLRWAVSYSNVLVITQRVMPRRSCSPAAAHTHLLSGPDCEQVTVHECVYIVLFVSCYFFSWQTPSRWA